MFEIVHNDLNSLESFSEEMEAKFEVREKQVHYIIQDLARETFLAEPLSQLM